MLHWVIVEKDGKNHYLEMPHRLYYELSFRSFIRFQELSKELESIDAEKEKALLYERRQAMNSVPLYAALALEGFINYYAVRYEIPFHKDTDRLSTSQKWNIYTQWKLGKSVKDDSIGKIRSIFKLRNNLVHAKPELGKMGEKEQPVGSSGQAHLENTDLGELLVNLNTIFLDTFELDPDELEQYKKEKWMYALQKIS
ncbi:hypothetical protein [Vibrio diabolicus]|uniref:hypothetical protein n=2 Tax=Vibrio diabolicus TaxID=50719 RepID=UPI0035A835BD